MGRAGIAIVTGGEVELVHTTERRVTEIVRAAVGVRAVEDDTPDAHSGVTSITHAACSAVIAWTAIDLEDICADPLDASPWRALRTLTCGVIDASEVGCLLRHLIQTRIRPVFPFRTIERCRRVDVVGSVYCPVGLNRSGRLSVGPSVMHDVSRLIRLDGLRRRVRPLEVLKRSGAAPSAYDDAQDGEESESTGLQRDHHPTLVELSARCTARRAQGG